MNLTKIFQIAAASAVAALGIASPAHAAVTATFSAGPACGGATSASFSPGGDSDRRAGRDIHPRVIGMCGVGHVEFSVA